MPRYDVKTPSREYAVWVAGGLLDQLATHLQGLGTVVIVSDERVARLYGARAARSLQDAGVVVHDWILPVGESSKSLWQTEALFDFLMSKQVDRDAGLLALGGGVVGDLSGFVASTWKRGVRFVNCPTSLLAVVDAAIGGKTALNHAGIKNTIGTFYQPWVVVIDPEVLGTLDDHEMSTGMAESVKHAVIADAEFLAWQQDHAAAIMGREPEVLEELILRNVDIKARHVRDDERDEYGERAKLNFGHTIGHALEVASGFQLSHGQAVALGMVGAHHVSLQRQLIDAGILEDLKRTLEIFGLPVALETEVEWSVVRSAMTADKKAGGGELRFVLADAVGSASSGHAVAEDEIRRAYEYLCESN